MRDGVEGTLDLQACLSMHTPGSALLAQHSACLAVPTTYLGQSACSCLPLPLPACP